METNYSPWPAEGKRTRFEFRRATWALARPWYNANGAKRTTLEDLVRIWPVTFWFPFFSVRTAYVHFYVGWKPINLSDPAFYWRDLGHIQRLVTAGRLFVQGGGRMGVGKIS